MKLKSSLGYNDYEIVEILRAVRRTHSKLTALYFRRVDFEFFRDLTSRVGGNKVL